MVTVSFVKFSGWRQGYAFTQMQLAHRHLAKVRGLEFYKLMGSGAGNGFSIWPDFSTYCLLAIWNDEKGSDEFFRSNPFWKEYTNKGYLKTHLILEPTKSPGPWDGTNPFTNRMVKSKSGPIAVLTRATIKPRFIPKFWSHVPNASQPVSSTNGHIFSKGVGEWPLFMQATISIWYDSESMYDYAYRNKAHVDMIRKTRELGWYKEEMFTEFNLISISMMS